MCYSVAKDFDKCLKKKIAVVTGCLGFIGKTFTEKLLSEGWYVYGIDKTLMLRINLMNMKG